MTLSVESICTRTGRWLRGCLQWRRGEHCDWSKGGRNAPENDTGAPKFAQLIWNCTHGSGEHRRRDVGDKRPLDDRGGSPLGQSLRCGDRSRAIAERGHDGWYSDHLPRLWPPLWQHHMQIRFRLPQYNKGCAQLGLPAPRDVPFFFTCSIIQK